MRIDRFKAKAKDALQTAFLFAAMLLVMVLYLAAM